jgi:uronate dehydrogenase
MLVLVTGVAGRIAAALVPRLSGEHTLRGLDVREPETAFPGDLVVGDCADPAVADEAVEGVDAVVHLAGIPSEADLPRILHDHAETTAALLDAMVQHHVRRMVYASSNHAVGMTPRQPLLRTDVRPRPDTFYGVGKVAAEALLSLYADRYGIVAVAMRIGSFLPASEASRSMASWLSHDDCARMVRAALTADIEGFHVVYGISDNTDAWWDLEPGRAIGYDPHDDAARVVGEVRPYRDDVAASGRVGGPFTTAEYDRRPFATADDDRRPFATDKGN